MEYRQIFHGGVGGFFGTANRHHHQQCDLSQEILERGNGLIISPELIGTLVGQLPLPPRDIHGVAHWGRVLENGQRLSPLTGARLDVVELFSVFHDSRRFNNGRDPEHGMRGAELAQQLRGVWFELDDAGLDLLVYACQWHTDGLLDADVTIQTCWDSDRLDLGRVGILPRLDMLCTPAARDPHVIAWANKRSILRKVPHAVLTVWQQDY